MVSRAAARFVSAVTVAAVLSGCVTITFDDPTQPPEAVETIVANESTDAPIANVPTAGTPSASPESTGPRRGLPTPRPTAEPAPAAGPPFPDRDADVQLYDYANVFSDATEGAARVLLASLALEQSADLVVYTQFKPGSTDESTDLDASNLMAQWEMGSGLVMMWNTTRPECQRGVEGNGFVRLYASDDYSTDYLSPTQRQDIFDSDMFPWLRLCDEDGALMGGLHAIRTAGYEPTIPTEPPSSGDEACTDNGYNLAGWWWNRPYRWRFASDSVPTEYNPDAVLDVIERSVSNITGAVNDCGLPDNVDAEAEYAGVTDDDFCGDAADGNNVIGFGELPTGFSPDTIAVTCPYGAGANLEADIVINTEVDWALSVDDCNGFQELLESTMTHEFGHVFGLDHVAERRHGYLTMSPITNGLCATDEITLGLGDVRGLEELY